MEWDNIRKKYRKEENKLMKKKALALLLAGSMLFGQNVYATDMASTEKMLTQILRILQRI